jgi:hypothetical protein
MPPTNQLNCLVYVERLVSDNLATKSNQVFIELSSHRLGCGGAEKPVLLSAHDIKPNRMLDAHF